MLGTLHLFYSIHLFSLCSVVVPLAEEFYHQSRIAFFSFSFLSP